MAKIWPDEALGFNKRLKGSDAQDRIYAIEVWYQLLKKGDLAKARIAARIMRKAFTRRGFIGRKITRFLDTGKHHYQKK